MQMKWIDSWRLRAQRAGLAVAMLGVVLAWLTPGDAHAQIVRPYTIRYQVNTNGDIAHVGNSNMSCPEPATADCILARNRTANGTGLANNNWAMAYLDMDADAFGPTFNSTSADLGMPAGSTVRFAGLYWGGNSASVARGQMLLKTPAAGGYATVTASQIDVQGASYAAFSDVTALVQAGNNGTYWGANIQSTTAANNWAGWALIVVYDSNTKPLRNLVVFDGYALINNAAGQTVSLSGFLTPYAGPVVTQAGTFGFDGDLGLVGDTLQVRSSTNPTYTAITDANNPANDFYNSTISDGGVFITTRNPAYNNTLGIDLDRFTLPSGIVGNGATTADILINTGGENYFPQVMTWATDIYVPVITPNIVKTATDLNGGSLVPGDILRWNISMSNTGLDTGTNLVLVDPIPAGTTYVPGSLVINTGPPGASIGGKDDAIAAPLNDQADFRTGPNRVVFRLGTGGGTGNPANDQANGGNLAFGQSTSLQFDTVVNAVAAGTLISNTATIYYSGQTLSSQNFTSSSSAASAIVLGAPTIAKTFTPAFMAAGGTSLLKVTIANPAANPGNLTGVSFTDTFPAGMIVSSSPSVNTICTAGSTPGTVTGGVALGNNIGMSPGATLAPGGSCDITVNVTAPAGNYPNVISAVTATNATSGAGVSATLSSGKLAVSKSFTPSTVRAGVAASLSVTITNPTASAVTGVSFTDVFPANLVIAGAPFGPFPAVPCGAGSTLLNSGGGALAAGNTGISMTNGQIAANSSCTFAVNVTGITGTTFGIFNNITSGVTYTGDAVAGNPSNTAALTMVGAPTVTKTMSPAIINAGDTSTVTITLTNPNTTTTLSRAATAFTDTYNTGTVNTNPANVTLNCSGASSASIVGGVAGGATAGMQNVSLAPLGSCTVTSVVVPSGAAPTSGTNTTGVVTFDNAPAAAAASAIYTVTALTEPTVTKSFSSTAVSAGSAVTMTITLVQASTTTNITGVAFTDTFPLGMVNTSGAAVIGGAAGCTGTATVTSGALSVSGMTIPFGASAAARTCTVSTTVSASSPGAYFNSAGNVTSTNAPVQTIPGTATLSTYRGLLVDKAFGTGSVAVGTGTTSLTVTITNPSGNPGIISASSIVDAFPANMQVATGGTLTVNAGCVASGTSTQTNNLGGAFANGDVGFALANYSVAIGTPCVVTVSAVRVITSGNFVNTVQTITSTQAGGLFPVAVQGTSTSATLSAGKVSITKAFTPATIIAGGTSFLDFTLTNSSAVAVTGLNFTDLLTSLPTRQLTLASATVGGTCTGVVTNAVAGGTSFQVTAGNVPASASCRITVQVTSTVPGIHPNQTTGVSTAADPVAGALSNIANLTVTPPPTVTKSFLPSAVAAGAASTLSVTITNINNFPVTGVSLIDTFPAGMVVATPLVTSNSCGGTLNDSGGGALGAGDVGIALTGGSVATNSACVIAISVEADIAGTYVNTIAAGALSSSAGSNSSAASATLNVLLPLSAVKSFTPASIAINGTSVLTVRLTNPNALDVTGAGFTDNYLAYSANLANTAAPAGSTSCPSGSVAAAANGTSLVLSGATVPASNFCDITVNVTSGVSGVRTNGGFVVAATNAGNTASNSASLSVGVPAMTKTFTPNPVSPGGVSTISFVITNSTGAAMSNTGFTDTFPAGMTLAYAPAVPQCGGTLYLANGTTTPPTAGGGSVRLGSSTGTNGGTMPANGSCTVLVAVTTPSAGIRLNTTGPVTSGALVGNLASDTLTTFAPPAVSKSFSPASVGVNLPAVLTIRLDNTNAFPMTGAGFTDTYPANLVNSPSPGGATTCAGGVVSAVAGAGTVVLAGGTIPASGFCLVTVNVTGVTAGGLVNAIAVGAVTTTNAGSNTVASNNATLTVLALPTVVKDFIGPSYVVPYGLAGTTMPLNTATVMRIRLTNPSATTAITGAAFTDNYPGGLVNAAAPNAVISGAGCTGAMSAAGGGASLGLTGMTIPASTTCTITVNVQASVANFYTNSTGVVTTINAGTAAAASATIYAMAPLSVSKSFTPNFVVNPPGTATSSMQVTLVNPNPYPVTGAAITDNYDSGNIDNVNPPVPSFTGTAGCGGTITATNGASAMTFATGVVPTSGTCVINVAVNLTPAGTNGVFTNCTDGITTANAGTAVDACATITKAAAPTTLPPVIAKIFTPSTIAVNGVSSLSFTVTNSNTAATTVNAVAFTDVLPAGLFVATPALPLNSCGGTWNATAGSTILNLTGGVLTGLASCSVSVAVTGTASGIYTNTTGTVSANTGTGNQTTAVLTILDPPDINKAFSPSAISQGGVSTISFVITNNNASAITNVAFTDSLTNMMIVNPPAAAVSGAGCTGFTISALNGGSLISVSGGTVPAAVGVTPGACTITVRVSSVVAGTWPNATSQTTSSAGTGAGSNSATLTVNAVSSSVSGYVFVDTNANGTRNLAEDWSAGVIVYVNIVSGGAVVQTVSVNPGTGSFNFPLVPYGNYTILVTNSPANATVVVPGGFTPTQPTTAAWNLLINGAAVASQDFGFVGPALSQVTGRVFRDTGFSAGTANDGVLTAGEAGSSPGLSGVAVAVTDCAATTYTATVTDGGGNFTLRFPSTATNVCIVETNLAGYLSTGASQNLTVIAPGTCAAPPGGGAFEYDRSADRICFSKTSGANISYSGLNFGDVPVNTFVADQTQQISPGNFVVYPHVFTFETGGSVTFGTVVVATAPNIPGWSEVLYRDSDCDGKLDASEPVITSATAVAVTATAPPGNKVCVIVKEFAPPSAPFGAQRVVRVDAAFTYTNASPGLSATYSRTDSTIMEDKAASGLRLVKEVCNESTTTCTDTSIDPSSLAGNGNYSTANTARPTDVLRYRIIYTNTASGTVTSVVINDTTPPFTDYVASTCASTPAGLVCTPTTSPLVCVANASCAVRWALTGGTLNAGAQGIVVYRVSVRP